jgi:hypothetical protein
LRYFDPVNVIRFGLTKPTRRITANVRDEGQGSSIPPEHFPKFPNLFFRDAVKMDLPKNFYRMERRKHDRMPSTAFESDKAFPFSEFLKFFDFVSNGLLAPPSE